MKHAPGARNGAGGFSFPKPMQNIGSEASFSSNLRALLRPPEKPRLSGYFGFFRAFSPFPEPLAILHRVPQVVFHLGYEMKNTPMPPLVVKYVIPKIKPPPYILAGASSFAHDPYNKQQKRPWRCRGN